jgi:hypothetical protein
VHQITISKHVYVRFEVLLVRIESNPCGDQVTTCVWDTSCCFFVAEAKLTGSHFGTTVSFVRDGARLRRQRHDQAKDAAEDAAEAAEATAAATSAHKPGEVDDGRGDLLTVEV